MSLEYQFKANNHQGEMINKCTNLKGKNGSGKVFLFAFSAVLLETH